LATCLETIVRWSARHPRHQPLVLFVEPKDDLGQPPAVDHLDELDAEIRAGLGPRLLTPDDVQGKARALAGAIRRTGWPTLARARGKVVVVFLAAGRTRLAYSRGRTSLAGRAMFVLGGETGPVVAVTSVPDPVAGRAHIEALVHEGLIVRTRADVDLSLPKTENEQRAAAALGGGAQLVTTDASTPSTGGYVVRVPGGTPSR